MVYQEYEITLSNGTVLSGSNSFETMDEAAEFIAQYAYGDDNRVLVIIDDASRPTFVLRRNIISLMVTKSKVEEEEGGN